MYKQNSFLALLTMTLLFSCVSDSLDKRLKTHVYYLASDELYGRESGTKYEKIAAEYIQNEFIEIGLEPMGDNGSYYQDFTFLASKSPGHSDQLIINGVELEIENTFIPLSFSKNGEFEGKLVKMGLGIKGKVPGFTGQKITNTIKNSVFLIEITNSDSNVSTGNWNYNDLHILTEIAENQGAKAVVFFSCDTSIIDLKANFTEDIPGVSIPALYLKDCNVISSEQNQIVSLRVDHIEDRRIGRNVIAFLDNGAENTIIIGGHHDHLGQVGLDGQLDSIDLNDTQSILNGADDGASGISLIIEFARFVERNSSDKNNYLFISFSGEEMGLLGSMYFNNNPTIDLSKASCMLSFDHIGRMNTEENSIIIYGVGTSPSWEKILDEINWNDCSITTYETGVGLTDYTSFYINNIPVLGFCTDVHADFHGVFDEADKINYDGMVKIFDIVTQINSSLTMTDKLEFTKTTDAQELLKFVLRHTHYSFEGSFDK